VAVFLEEIEQIVIPSPVVTRRYAAWWMLRLGQLKLVLILTFLLTLSIFSIVSLRQYFEVGEVALPNVTGLDLADAIEGLRASGFEATTFPETVAGAVANSVTSQSPDPGTVVRQGRVVTLGVHTPPEVARAPLLIGLQLADAIGRVGSLNLVVEEVQYVYHSSPSGSVVAQLPDPNDRLQPGVGLTVVVSRGAQEQSVALPDFKGIPLERAKDELLSLGFRRVETIATNLSLDRPGLVSTQSPESGTTVPTSTPITLYYSVSSDRIIRVPDLSGQPLRRARLMLSAAGLEVGTVTYLDDPERPAGIVSTEPTGHTLVGTAIALHVNRISDQSDTPRGSILGEPATSEEETEESIQGRRSIPFTFDPVRLGLRTLTDSEYELRLVVNDNEGERVVIERQVPAGQSVSTVVTVFGDALLQTYINDVFFQAWSP
jgi:beta-lactam-binding protein with PASTA domain